MQLLDKRRYFLLAAAGASIAFSITQIGPETTNHWFFLIVVALALYALSFVAGLSAIQSTNFLIAKNFQLLAEESKVAPSMAQALRKHVNDEVLDPLAARLERSDRFQLWFLVGGAIATATWKIFSCSECLNSLANTRIWET